MGIYLWRAGERGSLLLPTLKGCLLLLLLLWNQIRSSMGERRKGRRRERERERERERAQGRNDDGVKESWLGSGRVFFSFFPWKKPAGKCATDLRLRKYYFSLFAKKPVFARHWFFSWMSSHLFGLSKFIIVKYGPRRMKGNFFQGRHTSVVRTRKNIFLPLILFLFCENERGSERLAPKKKRRRGENPFGAAAAAEDEDDEEVEEGLGTKRKG